MTELPIDIDAINAGLWAARHLPLVIHQRMAELEAIRDTIEHLDAQGTCNGSVYWREPDSDSPKMYANHTYGTPCPLHGEPGFATGRVRHYVGASPERQEQTLAAMQRHEESTHLQAIFHRLRHELEHLHFRIGFVYQDLRVTRPATGEQPLIKSAEDRYARPDRW